MRPFSFLTASALGLAALCLAIACGTTAPSDVEAITFASVSAGGPTCGLTPAGAAYCWGRGGSLGDGTTTDRLTPTAVMMPAGVTFTRLGVGGDTCGLTPAGAVYCWGLAPVAVAMPAGVMFASLSDAAPYCAVTFAGVVYCWGDNDFGQLGDGTKTRRLTPGAIVIPAGVTFTSVSAGWLHACAVTQVGSTYCWGYNGEGELGDGTTTDRLTPVAVVMPAGVSFTSVSVGRAHTCGLTPGGVAYCWGYNLRGRLGDGTTTNRPTPTAVVMPAGATFASMSVGWDHTCGVTPAPIAFCWGRNVWGTVGDGTTTDRHTPVAVLMPAGVTFTRLAAGFAHTCALTPAGAAYCWGVNDDGRLGDGTTTDRLSPVAVVR